MIVAAKRAVELPKPIAPLWNTLALDRSAAASLQNQIIGYFRDAILKGRIKPGSRIPSSRMLSEEHGVARVTVIQAYDQLTAEGYLEARRGAGIFVSERLSYGFQINLQARCSDTERAKAPAPKRIIALRHILDRPRLPFALSLGMPAVKEFPWTVWARITQKIYRSQREEMLCYGDPCGARELRTAISQYMATARGIDCTPEQVIVVSGSQQGLNLAASALADRDEKIWVEEPGYPMARAAFEAASLEPVPVAVDREGIDVGAGILAAPFARLALVSPSYQYPLGVTLSLPRRFALLEWAEANDAWIIEDDYVGEFRYTGAPLPPLYSLDRSSRVLYLGTFSKTLAPALRQGFIIVPLELVERFKGLKLISDRQTPVLDQHVLAHFIAEGHFAAHVRRMRGLYSRRRQILLQALKDEAEGYLRVGSAPEVGLHVVAHLVPLVDDITISKRLLSRQIYAAPLSSFYATTAQSNGFALGFAGTPEAQIRPAVRELVKAIREESHTLTHTDLYQLADR